MSAPKSLLRWLIRPIGTSNESPRSTSRASEGRSKPGLQIESLEDRLVLTAPGLQISEFMAVNDSTITDEDGEFRDWIEIYNPTGSAVDLNGWYLTDDPDELDQWQFPAVTIESDDFLVVFASDKDRAVAGSQLHTNFRLRSNGDSVILVADDGVEIVHGYVEYPQQFSDISYGFAVTGDTNRLVSTGDDVAYHVPTAGDAVSVPGEGGDAGFAAIGFEDSAWVDSITLNDPTLVVTEFHTGETDWLEIQNVSSQTLDTTGWQVIINDASGGDVNAVHATAWSLPSSVSAGEVLYQTDDAGDNY